MTVATRCCPLGQYKAVLMYEGPNRRRGVRWRPSRLASVVRFVIPKKIHDRLGLAPGDYLDVELAQGKVVMTPKAPVAKRFKAELDQRLAEGLADFDAGRSHGPFDSAKEAITFLHTKKRKRARANVS